MEFRRGGNGCALVYVREYLATLPVTAGEMLLLRTRQPALMLQALARIFRGSTPRAATALVVVTLALTMAWIVLASLGRAVIAQNPARTLPRL